jgi:hypothetical protein
MHQNLFHTPGQVIAESRCPWSSNTKHCHVPCRSFANSRLVSPEPIHEVVFIQQLLEGLDMLCVDPTPLYCDSNSAGRLAEGQLWHSPFLCPVPLHDKPKLLVFFPRTKSLKSLPKLSCGLTSRSFECLRGYLMVPDIRSRYVSATHFICNLLILLS